MFEIQWIMTSVLADHRHCRVVRLGTVPKLDKRHFSLLLYERAIVVSELEGFLIYGLVGRRGDHTIIVFRFFFHTDAIYGFLDVNDIQYSFLERKVSFFMLP
jgi:hypothetical protein